MSPRIELTNQRTGTAYYLAQVKVDEAEEVQPLKEARMAPRMPALVILPTCERTALDAAAPPVVNPCFSRTAA